MKTHSSAPIALLIAGGLVSLGVGLVGFAPVTAELTTSTAATGDVVVQHTVVDWWGMAFVAALVLVAVVLFGFAGLLTYRRIRAAQPRP